VRDGDQRAAVLLAFGGHAAARRVALLSVRPVDADSRGGGVMAELDYLDDYYWPPGFCDALVAAAIGALPGYDDAPWDWTEETAWPQRPRLVLA